MSPDVPGKHAEAASAFGVVRFACPACGKHLRIRKKPAPRSVPSPCCGQTSTIPGAEPRTATPTPVRTIPRYAILVLVLVVAGCAVYANLAFAVKNPANFRYFPPFLPHVNGNGNRGL